jgi:metal-sulfur cluster biosynthetic enzyme
MANEIFPPGHRPLLSETRVLAALQDVIDPELGVNVVDLGLVFGVDLRQGRVGVRMTLTSSGCPLGGVLTAAVAEAIEAALPEVAAVDVELVWEPPWSPDRVSEAGREQLGWIE